MKEILCVCMCILGVLMSIEWEDKLLFVTSADVPPSSPLLSRVNTLVLSPPDYPITLHSYPPSTTQHNNKV